MPDFFWTEKRWRISRKEKSDISIKYINGGGGDNPSPSTGRLCGVMSGNRSVLCRNAINVAMDKAESRFPSDYKDTIEVQEKQIGAGDKWVERGEKIVKKFSGVKYWDSVHYAGEIKFLDF